MYESEDHQFFDELYQLWAKTTWAGFSYWMPEEYTDQSGRHRIYAVHQADINGPQRKLIASSLKDEDADFIASLHGAIPDLIRRLHEAIDEAESKDEARDQAEENYLEALLENVGLRSELHDLEIKYHELEQRLSK